MKIADHPMKPTEDQIREWARFDSAGLTPDGLWHRIACAAYAAGADAELRACCDIIYLREEQPLCGGTAEWLRATRRPKPPSLKQQAIQRLVDIEHGATPSPDDYSTIRRALKALPDE